MGVLKDCQDEMLDIVKNKLDKYVKDQDSTKEIDQNLQARLLVRASIIMHLNQRYPTNIIQQAKRNLLSDIGLQSDGTPSKSSI